MDKQEPSFDLSNLKAARESAISLQRVKKLVAATKAEGFVPELDRLWGAAHRENGSQVLEALALLFRISAVAKHIRDHTYSLAAQLDAPPTAAANELPDSDDRRYLGEAIAFATGTWKVAYAATAAVEEVAGEEAREQFVSATLAAAGTVSGGLTALSEAFETLRIDTNDVGATRARRLGRVCNAIRKGLVEGDPEIGEQVGTRLLELLRSGLSGETVVDSSARIQAGEAILELLTTIVRFHFSLASDVETYGAAMSVRRWFVSETPPPELAPHLRAIGRQIIEAITLMAKQGIASEELRKTLLSVIGNGAATAELRRVGTHTPGIPSDLRLWLQTGKRLLPRIGNSDAIDETVLRTMDKDVASLFRDAAELRSILDRLEDDLPVAISGYEPKLVPVVERLSTTSRRMTSRIEMLAARRQMRFEAGPGAIVEYNPVDHELPPSGLKGRSAKIKLPSVVRGLDGAAPIVILRAELEGE